MVMSVFSTRSLIIVTSLLTTSSCEPADPSSELSAFRTSLRSTPFVSGKELTGESRSAEEIGLETPFSVEAVSSSSNETFVVGPCTRLSFAISSASTVLLLKSSGGVIIGELVTAARSSRDLESSRRVTMGEISF